MTEEYIPPPNRIERFYLRNGDIRIVATNKRTGRKVAHATFTSKLNYCRYFYRNSKSDHIMPLTMAELENRLEHEI